MQLAIDDFGGKVLGRPIEILQADHQTKPDVGAAIARKWYDVDGVKMITGIGTSSVALAVRKIAQEKGMIDINTGAASADLTGPGLLADRRALGLRHLRAGQGDRRRGREGRRRFVVLPHRRLRLRPCAGARRDGGRDGCRRQGGGRRQASAQHAGLLVVPAAGPGLQGQDHRPRQCRPGHDQLDQAGGRVRHRQGRPASGRSPGLLDRRAGADPAGGAGPGADRGILLGSQRRDPRLDQALTAPRRTSCRAC